METDSGPRAALEYVQTVAISGPRANMRPAGQVSVLANWDSSGPRAKKFF